MSKRFLVSVEARIGPSTRVRFESEKPIVGYYQQLGVTALDEVEMIRLVRDFVENDIAAEFVAIDEIWVPDFSGRDSEIKNLCGDTAKVGVWYHSGRAFLGEEDDQDE